MVLQQHLFHFCSLPYILLLKRFRLFFCTIIFTFAQSILISIVMYEILRCDLSAKSTPAKLYIYDTLFKWISLKLSIVVIFYLSLCTV